MNEEKPNSYVAIKVICSMVNFMIKALPTRGMQMYFVGELLASLGGHKIEVFAEEEEENEHIH